MGPGRRKGPKNSRERRLNEDKTWMDAEIVSLERELKNAKAMQGDESESIEFLNNLPKEQQVDMQKIQEELMEYKIKVEDFTWEKDELMVNFESEKTTLVVKNDELMAKLKTMQIEILQNKVDYLLQINALENQLWSEWLEKDVCVQRIKELESLVKAPQDKLLNVQKDVQKNVELLEKLKTIQTQINQSETDREPKVNALGNQLRSEQVEENICLQKIQELESLVGATEEKWLNVQKDLHMNVELLEKLMAMQTQIHQSQTDWDVKVDNLKNPLRSEQLEKETFLKKIKELKGLVKATEKKLLNLQEDSQIKVQKMEEDIKFLKGKTITLQELALMSDSDKARRRKDERKAQKEEEKRVEKELKEKKKQEKGEKKQREKELKEKKKQEKTEKNHTEKEEKEKRKT